VDYAQKVYEYQANHPKEYAQLELQGPEGMSKLIKQLYGGRVPEDLNFQALHERIADSDLVLKEQNAFAKAIIYSHSANRWAMSAETMKYFAERLHQPDVPDHIKKLGDHFLDQALNAAKNDAMSVARALGSDNPHRALISYLQTSAGIGAYGFKPSSAATILMHNYLEGVGFLGSEAVNQGFKATSESGLEGLQKKFDNGVFSGRVPILHGFENATMGSGLFSKAFTKVSNAAGFFVQNGHIIGRASIYDAASWLFDRHIQPWMDGGRLGDWEDKSHAIRGYALDQGTLIRVEHLLGQGNYAEARHAYAQNMTDMICAQFRPEDQGRALNSGVVSRMYGQLMVVPTNYAASLARIAGSGSFTDRVANVAAYAKSTAAFYGASRLAGLSGTNLLPWRILTLRGGPLWQNMVALTQSQPGSPMLKTAEKALTAMAPGGPQVVQLSQVVNDVQHDNWWGAFLTANGFSTRPDLRSPK
jgi:hypothetical protein